MGAAANVVSFAFHPGRCWQFMSPFLLDCRGWTGAKRKQQFVIPECPSGAPIDPGRTDLKRFIALYGGGIFDRGWYEAIAHAQSAFCHQIRSFMDKCQRVLRLPADEV